LRPPTPAPTLLEVGLPYSDPLADGATLQRASGAVLGAGATLERSLGSSSASVQPARPADRADGHANQVLGGGDGEAGQSAWPAPVRPGSSSPT